MQLSRNLNRIDPVPAGEEFASPALSSAGEIKVKRKIWYALTLSGLLLLALQARADRDRDFKRGRFHQRGNERSERPQRVTPGRPVHGGNGCPQGTMSVAFAPDNLSFSILFDQFIAQTNPAPGERRDVMTCDIQVPVQLPDNMQMEITRVDFRGFVGLPEAGSRAILQSMFNFRGRGGDGDRLNLRYTFNGPVMDDYEISSDVIAVNANNSTEISPCGGQTTLRIYNQLRLQSPRGSQPAQVTIDSIDGGAHAIYYVNWKSCTPKAGPKEDRDGRPGRGFGHR